MIWIRADANGEIGAGHVMRCLAIAGALERLGQRVCFLTADEGASGLLRERGQACRVLQTDYTHMEEEQWLLEELAARERPGFLLIDSYFVTDGYLREARRLAPVGYVDDMLRWELPADLFVNYNVYAREAFESRNEGAEGSAGKAAEEDRGRSCAGAGPRYLLGPEYAPLRPEFAGARYEVRERARQVLITTGGSDRYDLAGKLLRELLSRRETAGLKYVAVSGAYNSHLSGLRELEERHGNVEIRCGVRNMSELMRESDIAVSAGGSTMYELSAVGVPTVCFSFVDNQERIAAGFVRQGLACFGGSYLAGGDGMIAEAAQAVASLAGDLGLRLALNRRQRRLVDGGGALRIAEEIVRLSRKA